jgi:hypothetical protein
MCVDIDESLQELLVEDLFMMLLEMTLVISVVAAGSLMVGLVVAGVILCGVGLIVVLVVCCQGIPEPTILAGDSLT